MSDVSLTPTVDQIWTAVSAVAGLLGFGAGRAGKASLRNEMVTRSHDLNNKLQAKNTADAVEMTKMRMRVVALRRDVAKIESKTTAEVRRLEEMIQSNHKDIKADLKEITEKITAVIERRRADAVRDTP